MSKSNLSCRVTAGQAGRIDLVAQTLTGLSRAQVRGLFDHGCVTLNGAPAPSAAERVVPDDLVEVSYDPHTRYREKPRPHVDPALKILMQDEHIIVVDKPALLLTVPTDRGEPNTLERRVRRHLARGGREPRIHVVQRLDRGTSGVLVFAITEVAARELIRQFSRHEPTREYVALVAGDIAQDQGTFESRLATNRALSRYSVGEGGRGERAVTHFQVEVRLPGATRVRVRLETGRRNQIRVHFAEAGHPVLGDSRYRPELARHPRWPSRRHALHAAVLAFRHPVTGESLRFESPLPPEFVQFQYGRDH